MITFGSLFAGIGGFDLGFERAGMTCKWQVEINDYSTKILEKHWPNVHRERDVRECGRHNLSEVDVICAGFPCQDISYAGQRAGLDGERSGLFFDAIRVVRELRPRSVVLENVAGLLSGGLDRVIGSLAAIGFDAEWHCIPAAAIGAPHIRDRAFVLGYSNSGQCDRTESEVQTGRPVLELSSQVPNASGEGPPASEQEELQREGRGIEGRTTAECGWWSIEPNVGRMAHGVPRRVDRIKGLGNAIVPQVAELVGRHVVRVLEQSDV